MRRGGAALSLSLTHPVAVAVDERAPIGYSYRRGEGPIHRLQLQEGRGTHT
jgi:hypothetical protein